MGLWVSLLKIKNLNILYKDKRCVNLVYICSENIFDKSAIGIKNKVFYQMESFFNKGYKPYLINIDIFQISLFDYRRSKKRKFIYKNQKEMYNFILSEIIHLLPKIIYVRHKFPIDYFLFKFYKELKQNYYGSMLILEFPTLPYDKQIKDNNMLEIDKFYRCKLKYIFDFSVNFNNFKKVFGLKSLHINNGISLSNIPIIKNSKFLDKKIKLIGVSDLNYWQGYDRLIEGLSKYYKEFFNEKKYFISIDIVGDGPDLFNLKQLSKTNNVDKYIKFYGILESMELDKVFEEANIAVGGLKPYTINIKKACPLKNREYCARGIPFIVACKDLAFNSSFKYMLKVSNSKEPIDMLQIIKFYERLRNMDNISFEMRKFAEENLRWDKSFQILFDEIEKLKN